MLMLFVLSAMRAEYLHVIMETKGGKKSKKSSIQYESPLGYVIEDVRPHGGSEKFRTAAYSNVSRCKLFRFFVFVLALPLNWIVVMYMHLHDWNVP
jgi:S-adenosylmethionine decarboxylase